MRILVIEDEKERREDLESTLRSLLSPTDTVDHATSHQSAEQKLRSHWDLVFMDLLLLPSEVELKGLTLSSPNKEPEHFGPDQYDQYVLREGGVDLIEKLRAGGFGERRQLPVVVTSFFDSLSGYRNLLRRCGFEGDPNIHLLPKPPTNPQHWLNAGARQQWTSSIKELVRGRWLQASTHAQELRQTLVQMRQELLLLEVVKQLKDQNKTAARVILDQVRSLLYSLTLVVRFDPERDEDLLWDLALDSDARLGGSEYYRSWQRLRDSVLLNPLVPFDMRLRISDPTGEHYECALSDSTGSAKGGRKERADTEARRLRDSCLLAYLAFRSEPPVALVRKEQFEIRGWIMTSREWLGGAMHGCTSQLLKKHVQDTGSHIKWPGVNELPLATFLACEEQARENSERPDDSIHTLKTNLTKDLQGEWLEPSDVVPTIRGGRGGLFFDGDIELEYRQTDVTGAALTGKRFHLITSCSRRLQVKCDHNAFDVQDLAARLRREGAAVQLHPDVEGLRDAVAKDDVLIDFAADRGQAQFWYRHAMRNSARFQELMDLCACVILIPDSPLEVQNSPGDFVTLRERGLHVVFPGVNSILPVAKLIDSIICPTVRVKYRAERATDMGLDQRWERTVAETIDAFRRAVERLRAADALGDASSGSHSIRMRMPDGRLGCLITSSETDKSALVPERLALVSRFDPLNNVCTWAGKNRPSSSLPWHMCIYRSFPDVDAIIHTHCKPVTYARKLEAYRTARYVEYGSMATAKSVMEVLGQNEERFVILKDHGEAAGAASLDDAVDLLIQMRMRVVTE